MAFAKEMLEIAVKLKSDNHKVTVPYNVEKYADGTLTNEASRESIKRKGFYVL